MFHLVTFSRWGLRGGLFIPSVGDGLTLVSFAESLNFLPRSTARVEVRFHASKGDHTGNKAVPTRVRVCVCRGRGDAVMCVPVYVSLFLPPRCVLPWQRRTVYGTWRRSPTTLRKNIKWLRWWECARGRYRLALSEALRRNELVGERSCTIIVAIWRSMGVPLQGQDAR